MNAGSPHDPDAHTGTQDPPRENGLTRRKALGALAALAVLPAAAKAKPREQGTSSRVVRWGMTIDLDKCSACQACVVACRVENNVPIAGPEQVEEDRGIYWMDMLTVEEGEYPEIDRQIVPTPCNHCDNAPCVKVCPVGATFINEEGIVAQIWARCIGCRYCTTACPYTRRYFNWRAPDWNGEDRQRLNPDVATRPRGVVEKCTFCHQRIRATRERVRSEGRELADEDVRRLPACAEMCPAEAITFGDLNDHESEVTHLSKSPRSFRLQEELGTEPKVYFLREAKWRE